MGRGRWKAVTAILAFAAVACGGDGGKITGPNPKDLTIAVQGGDQQVWSPATALPKPLQVVVTNVSSRTPASGVTVTWRVTQGTGATVSPATSVTDSSGIASTSLTLGSATGTYTVVADFSGNIGQPATFTAEAASGLSVTGVTQTSARAGDTITINGSGFSATPGNNVVLFAGVRGAVVSATSTQLRVIVPLCLPAGATPVVVVLGASTSTPVSLSVTGTGGSTLSLAVGQVALLTDPTALNCARLPSGSSYLLVVENATDVSNRPMDFQLLGVGSTTTTSTAFVPRSFASLISGRQADPAATFDANLRQSESVLAERARNRGAVPARQLAPYAVGAALPVVGDSANFNVLTDINSSSSFATIKAKVQLVTTRAIIYQDVNVPTGGFTLADFQQFGALFDDPIYPTDTNVFGQPSDVDANGHIVILFTQQVNKLTPASSTSFIAGFFYGCDLLSPTDCPKSNRAEIFYASVPDPSGTVGTRLSKTRILQTTPPVLAHEFMHMIHFNQRVLLRGASDEALWLSEALAHTAEDTVGGVFLARGDSSTAAQFMGENWSRANEYLDNTAGTSLLAFESPGTLAERGAGWLFLKYLRGRFGGQVITKITQACTNVPCPLAPSSATNVVAQTGLGWSLLVNDFDIALWASDAPDLAGAGLDPRYTFTNFRPRRTLGQPALGGVFLLQPTPEPFSGFSTSGTVLSATSAYYSVTGAATAGPLAVSLAAPGGLPFASGIVPQLAILRYR